MSTSSETAIKPGQKHVVSIETPEAGTSEYKDGKDLIYNNDPSVEFYRISWKNEKVQKDGMKKADFISGYASWDVFEDFAESFSYYALHRNAFEQRAKTNPVIAAKLAWFKKNVQLQPGEIATGKSTWTGTVPWDTTKLAYEWMPEGKVEVAVR